MCKGSDKTVDKIEFKGLPWVNEERKLERTFNAGGMPARARGAITREGKRGRAKRNVASASGPEKSVEMGVCRAI